jgi:hypothetical protein
MTSYVKANIANSLSDPKAAWESPLRLLSAAEAESPTPRQLARFIEAFPYEKQNG